MTEFWKYEFRSQRWSRLRDLPFAYIGQPQILQVDDLGVFAVVSNHKEKSWPATCIYRYALEDDSWTLESQCPDSTMFHPKSFLLSDELYVFFETTKYADWFSGQLMRYSFLHRQWTALSAFPYPKRLSTFAFSDGQKGFIGGGFYDKPLSDIYVYDPVSDKWSPAAELDRGIFSGSTWSFGGKRYIGFGVQEPQRRSRIWQFDKKPQ